MGCHRVRQVFVGEDGSRFSAPDATSGAILTIEQDTMQSRSWGAPRPAGRDDGRPEVSL